MERVSLFSFYQVHSDFFRLERKQENCRKDVDFSRDNEIAFVHFYFILFLFFFRLPFGWIFDFLFYCRSNQHIPPELRSGNAQKMEKRNHFRLEEDATKKQFQSQVWCFSLKWRVCNILVWDEIRWKVVSAGDDFVTPSTVPLSDVRAGWKTTTNLSLRISFHWAAIRQFHITQLSGFLSGRNTLLLRFSRTQMGRHPNSVPFFRFGITLHRRVWWNY